MWVVRYRDWVAATMRRVHRASKGRVGYVHVPDMEGTGYAELVRYLSLGGVIAVAALCIAVFRVSSERRRGRWLAVQISAVLVAALALWTGLVVGVHLGYGEWQGAADAGDQAYADGAKLVGSLVFGWMPSGFLAVLGWSFLTVARRFSRRLARHAARSPRDGG